MVQNWRASSKPRGNVVKNNKVIPWNIGTKRGWADIRFILPFYGPTFTVWYRKISRLNGLESEIVLHGITVIFFDSISRSSILFFLWINCHASTWPSGEFQSWNYIIFFILWNHFIYILIFLSWIIIRLCNISLM